MPVTNGYPFLLGVNYPWLRYGQDFGETTDSHIGVSTPQAKQTIEEDFARIRDCGAAVVRWFMFSDGRGGFVSSNGIPQRPDDFLFADVGAALQAAERSRLKICFSLIDHLWLQDRRLPGGSPNDRVLQFTASREAFLENVLLPLFREFRAHPALFAWEIANEPEWAIREFHPVPAAKIHIADFRAFATEVAHAVREFAAVPVTLGSARLMWVRAWREVGLDFYQAHYYPGSEVDAGDLATQLAPLARLDKPLWLGEIPARDPAAGHYSLISALNTCRDADILGAAVWRWTTPQATDTDQAIGCVEPETLEAWAASERAQSQRA
ncbi:MAG TPA: hypothetical protein VGI13_02595 [Candidatus Acidoferrum sp.]|jgi:hypothetical protein